MDRLEMIRLLCLLLLFVPPFIHEAHAVTGYPDHIILRGPNQLPFNVLRGTYLPVSEYVGNRGGATLPTRFDARVNNLPLVIDAKRNVTPSNLAKAARVGARLLGPAAVGLALYDFLVDPETGEITAPQSPTVTVYDAQNARWGVSNGCGGNGSLTQIAAACSPAGVWAPERRVEPTGVFTPAANNLSGHIQFRLYWTVNNQYLGLVTKQVNRLQLCPPGTYPNFGSCSTPTYAPVSDSDLETAIFDELTSLESGQDVAQRLINNNIPIDSEPTETSGPSTIEGDTSITTTTGPDGTTTRTTTEHFDLGYDGDTVSATRRTTTTTENPDGSTDTETTIETPSPGSGEPPPETPGFCDLYPDISACQELGDPDQDEELQQEERNFLIEPTMTATGSCPAPIMINLRAQSFELSYQPTCMAASFLRPIIISMAWLSAGLFVFGAFRP